MKNKNIFFISNGFGGVATHQAYHIEYLIRRGFKVTLIDEIPENTSKKIQKKLIIVS